jgi:hypothetical protein
VETRGLDELHAALFMESRTRGPCWRREVGNPGYAPVEMTKGERCFLGKVIDEQTPIINVWGGFVVQDTVKVLFAKNSGRSTLRLLPWMSYPAGWQHRRATASTRTYRDKFVQS